MGPWFAHGGRLPHDKSGEGCTNAVFYASCILDLAGGLRALNTPKARPVVRGCLTNPEPAKALRRDGEHWLDHLRFMDLKSTPGCGHVTDRKEFLKAVKEDEEERLKSVWTEDGGPHLTLVQGNHAQAAFLKHVRTWLRDVLHDDRPVLFVPHPSWFGGHAQRVTMWESLQSHHLVPIRGQDTPYRWSKGEWRLATRV